MARASDMASTKQFRTSRNTPCWASDPPGNTADCPHWCCVLGPEGQGIPNELSEKVFGYLTKNSDRLNFALACKKFYAIFKKSILWKTLHITEAVLSRPNRFEKLMKAIPRQLKRIRHIYIENKSMDILRVPDQFLNHIKSHVHTAGIRSIKMSHCMYGPIAYSTLIVKCTGIQHLGLPYCVKRKGKHHFFAPMVGSLLQNSLVSLDLRWCPLVTEMEFCLYKDRPNIRELRLEGSSNLTDDFFTILAKNGKGLERISAEDCDNVSDKGMETLLGAHGKNLIELRLRLSRITGSRLIEAGKGSLQLAKLQKLKLGICPKMTTAHVETLFKTWKMPNLEWVDLYGWDCLTPATIVSLVDNFPQLRCLVFAPRLELVDEASLLRLAETRGHQLTALTLGELDKVSPEGFSTFLSHCTGLTELCLTGSLVTNSVLELLAERCPRLSKLKLISVYNVTDVGLNCLADECPQLDELVLKVAPKVTEYGLAQLGRAHHLSRLDVCGLEGIDLCRLLAVLRGLEARRGNIVTRLNGFLLYRFRNKKNSHEISISRS